MTVLLVLTTFILFIAVSFILQWRRKRAGAETVSVPKKPRALNLQDFRLPKGVFFHPHHTWAALLPQGQVQIGIDDLIRNLTGTIDAIRIPEIGDQIERGSPFLEIILGTCRVRISAPFTGKVIRVNDDLLDNLPDEVPGLLNHDWFVELEPSRLSDEIGVLTVAERAREWFRTEMDRFREFLSDQALRPALAGVTLADGGVPVVGVLQSLDVEGLSRFEQEFLGGSVNTTN